jgi:hypothetical protein
MSDLPETEADLAALRAGGVVRAAHVAGADHDFGLVGRVQTEAANTPSAASIEKSKKAKAKGIATYTEGVRARNGDRRRSARNSPATTGGAADPVDAEMEEEDDDAASDAEEEEVEEYAAGERDSEHDPDRTPHKGTRAKRPSGLNKAQTDARDAQQLDDEQNEIDAAKARSNSKPAPKKPAALGALEAAVKEMARTSAPTFVWVQISCQIKELRAALTPTLVMDTVQMAFIDLLDANRPGGRVKDIPPAPVAGDMTKKQGPWWIAFATRVQAAAFVAAQGSEIYIDLPDDSTTVCKLFIDTNTKDLRAAALAEEFGLWSEIVVGRTNLIRNVKHAALLFEQATNLVVLACKNPRTKCGGPRETTKFCIKAMVKPHEEPLFPPLILVPLPGGGSEGFRYKTQPDYFPGRCSDCHATLKKCRCEKVDVRCSGWASARTNAAKNMKERRERIAKGQPADAAAAGPSTGAAPRSNDAIRIRNRYLASIRATCLAQNICVHFQIGACAFKDTCTKRHEKLVRRQPPPLRAGRRHSSR